MDMIRIYRAISVLTKLITAMARATITAKAIPAVAFATSRPPAIVIRTITMRNKMVFGSIVVVILFILMECDCLVLGSQGTDHKISPFGRNDRREVEMTERRTGMTERRTGMTRVDGFPLVFVLGYTYRGRE